MLSDLEPKPTQKEEMNVQKRLAFYLHAACIDLAEFVEWSELQYKPGRS